MAGGCWASSHLYPQDINLHGSLSDYREVNATERFLLLTFPKRAGSHAGPMGKHQGGQESEDRSERVSRADPFLRFPWKRQVRAGWAVWGRLV